MPSRPKHQDKDIERKLLRAVEASGWQVTKDTKYFKLVCPCGDHQTWVHLTPSNPYYLRQRLSYLKSQTCWKG